MHLQSILPILLLPTLALTQEQKPLLANLQDQAFSLFESAKAYIPAAYLPTPAASGDGPIKPLASKIAAKNVIPLTKDNWKSVLQPSAASIASATTENWMVLVTGGNKTCFGLCGNVDAAWNASAAMLALDSTSPHLASIDCDAQPVLCATWLSAAPSIWYIERPADPLAETPIHIVSLNVTKPVEFTQKQILAVHTKKTYKNVVRHQGWFHPYDGQLAKAFLNVPAGYALWAFGLVQSWVFMLLISFASRSVM